MAADQGDADALHAKSDGRQLAKGCQGGLWGGSLIALDESSIARDVGSPFRHAIALPICRSEGACHVVSNGVSGAFVSRHGNPDILVHLGHPLILARAHCQCLIELACRRRWRRWQLPVDSRAAESRDIAGNLSRELKPVSRDHWQTGLNFLPRPSARLGIAR